MYRKHNKALTGYARQLRQGMTQEERKLWYEFLRGYPVRFLRQKVIGQYIVDFYCAQAGLVLEIDGGQKKKILFRIRCAVWFCANTVL